MHVTKNYLSIITINYEQKVPYTRIILRKLSNEPDKHCLNLINKLNIALFSLY